MKTALAALRGMFAPMKAGLAEAFKPTWDHDDDPPDLEAETAARTEWVRKNRHLEGGD